MSAFGAERDKLGGSMCRPSHSNNRTDAKPRLVNQWGTPHAERKLEIIMLVAAIAVVIAIVAIGATRESTEAANHLRPVASHNQIDPATMQLKVDIFNLQRATVDLPY